VTPKGDALRDQMEDELLATMLPLEQLDPAQRVQLRDLLAAVAPSRPELGEGDAALNCAISS